jgi:hypothetical protein
MGTIDQRRRLSIIAATAAAMALVLAGVGYAVLTDNAAPLDQSRAERSPSVLPPPTGGPPSASASNKGPPASSRSRPPTTARPPGSALVRWIRKFTPAGGGDRDAYNSFMQHDCEATLIAARDSSDEDGVQLLPEPYRSLYEGAAAACLAGLEGRSELWSIAMSRFPAVDPTALDCWEREVHMVYKALIDAHRASQRIVLAEDSSYSAGCPEVTGLDPDHGPRTGGYAITVIGRNLPPVLDLDWSGLDLTIRALRGADGGMTMIAPAVGPDVDPYHPVRIYGAPRIQAPLGAEFRYDD